LLAALAALLLPAIALAQSGTSTIVRFSSVSRCLGASVARGRRGPVIDVFVMVNG